MRAKGVLEGKISEQKDTYRANRIGVKIIRSIDYITITTLPVCPEHGLWKDQGGKRK